MSDQWMPKSYSVSVALGPLYGVLKHRCPSGEAISPLSFAVALNGGQMLPGVASAQRGAHRQARLCRVLDFIERNLEESLPIGLLADVACLSKFHFSRAFRSSVGKSPHQYISERRTEYAKKLLRETTQSVVDIAMICNFSSHANFCRAFRRATGMAPSEYRSVAVGA